jgi:hypothetical protein
MLHAEGLMKEQDRPVRLKAPTSFTDDVVFTPLTGPLTLSKRRTVDTRLSRAGDLKGAGWSEVHPAPTETQVPAELHVPAPNQIDPDWSDDKFNQLRRHRLKALNHYRSIQSKQDGTVCLGKAIEWVSKLDGLGGRSVETDPVRLKATMKELKKALFDGHLGGRDAAPIIMIAEDQDVWRLSKRDIDLIKGRNAYRDVSSAKELLRRLWVSRRLLLAHFRKRNWPIPDWLADHNEASPSPKPREHKTRGHRGQNVLKAYKTLFPDGATTLSAEAIAQAIGNSLGTGTPHVRMVQRMLEKLRNK